MSSCKGPLGSLGLLTGAPGLTTCATYSQALGLLYGYSAASRKSHLEKNKTKENENPAVTDKSYRTVLKFHLGPLQAGRAQ